MCGIAGIWRFNNTVTTDEIRSFTDSMKHRGPDGAGYELLENNHLGLGHRRLSILDLTEAGKQPMSYADKRYWLTFNGEIYNFIEIRAELEKKGHRFVSESDSEVILAAYAEWGNACFNKFNGMWAIAIWDTSEKKLTLCRDRYGVKPLHYTFKPGYYFAFASETIAFGYMKDFKKEADPEHLRFAIAHSTLLEPSGETIYKQVRQLKAGHMAVLTTGGDLSITRWWNTTDHLWKETRSYNEQVETFREIFFDAIKLRLRSDVSVASALSGGIDSSSVFCSIAHLAKHAQGVSRLPADWQQAYSISFPGTSVDEADYVKLIQKELQADVKILVPDYNNLIRDIETTTHLFDAVTGTPIIALTDVYKGMRQHGITVSMDGHGGDELLFGYSSSVYKVMADAFENRTDDKRELVETYLNLHHQNVNSDLVNATYDRINKQHQGSASYGFKQFIKKLTGRGGPKAAGLNDSPLTHYMDIQAPRYFSEASRFLFNEFHFNEIPYNLRDFDRAAMQNQIEIRMPLMDYRLVNYCFSLPVESKIGRGYTKRILRDAMKEIVPEPILKRKSKIGLGAPTKDWFNDQLSTYIRDAVSSLDFMNSNYWDGKNIAGQVHQRCESRSWDYTSANEFWKILNAYLLLKG